MCIATFALGSTSAYPLILAANRDELHSRPTAEADWWSDADSILGGRDLLAGGSWLAIDRAGRLAAVTNIPSGGRAESRRSRGMLVREFLSRDDTAAAFVATVAEQAHDYGAFNFLAYDGREFHYVGTGSEPRRIDAGVHALSNAPLGSDWPKIHAARAGLTENIENGDLETALFELLARGSNGTAQPVSKEQRRTDIFIKDPRHGTRSSTVVLVAVNGSVRFVERSFTAEGEPATERTHEFAIDA